MFEPRYGIWVPVGGNYGAMHHPESPLDASYGRAKALLQLAEDCGFTTTLIAQHLFNIRSDEFEQLETWTAAAALAEATEKIEIIAAIKPLLFHPVVLAKFALNIDAISNGRFAINLVSAWYKPEMEKTGVPFPQHDDRYRYSTEWLQVVKALWRGDRVNFQGEYFQIQELSLRPIAQPQPRVYLGGESDPAHVLAAQAADVFFLNGRPIKVIRQTIAKVSQIPRPQAQPLRFGMAAFVIARPTEAEAQANLEWLFELAKNDNKEMAKGIDSNVVMFKNIAQYPAVGGNGGTAAGLVGTYDQVAARIVEFVQAGVDTFMLQFQPYPVEMRRFSEEVMPRVRVLIGSHTEAAPPVVTV